MDKKLKLEDIVPQYIQEYDNKAKQILNAIKSYYMGYIVYDFTKLDVDSITTFNIIIALKKNLDKMEEESRYGCILFVNDELCEKFITNIADFFDGFDVRYKNRDDPATRNT